MGVVGPWWVLFDFLFDCGIQSLGQSFRKGPGWRFVFIRRMGRRHGGWRYKRVKSGRLKYGTMRWLLGAISGHRLGTIRHWGRFYIRFILTFIKHCFRMCRGRYVRVVWFGHFLSGGHLPATLRCEGGGIDTVLQWDRSPRGGSVRPCCAIVVGWGCLMIWLCCAIVMGWECLAIRLCCTIAVRWGSLTNWSCCAIFMGWG